MQFLKISSRSAMRNKVFSIVNVFGLALGLASCLLIMLWVNAEQSVDAFHANGARLYSVWQKQFNDGEKDAGYYTPGVLAEEMKTVLPEVEFAAGKAWERLRAFEVNDKILKEHGGFAGKDFFNLFSYKIIQGTAASALLMPVDIAISRKMANDFFGSPEAAIGKAIRFENKKDLRVAAVFENVSDASSLRFDFMINWETFLEDNAWAKQWGNNGPSTYFTLRNGTNAAAFEKKFKNFLDLYNKDQTKSFHIELYIQPYSDQYLHSNFKAASWKVAGSNTSGCSVS